MTVVYHPRALAEIRCEMAWYARREPRVAYALLQRIEDAVRAVEDAPDSFPEIAGRATFRRVVLPRFPFSIVYQVRDNQVVVIALAHAKRRPGYWARRRL